MDSTIMHINKGNAHGTQRERTKEPKMTLYVKWFLDLFFS